MTMTTKSSHYTNFGVAVQPRVSDIDGYIYYRSNFRSSLPESEWTAGERWVNDHEEMIEAWREGRQSCR